MCNTTCQRTLSCALLLMAMALTQQPLGAQTLPARVQFNRHIRPILSENCFKCHGPDKNNRKAKLRLDTEEGAFADLDGYKAIVRGKPEMSELYLRLTTTDKTDIMPPRKTNKVLTKHEIALIKRWIEQGAQWQGHWSFITPTRPAVPKVKSSNPIANPIDAFIYARLAKEGLTPAPLADRRTLIRRVTLDLTGLPPTTQQIEQFLADKSPNAYEKLVDRLLASPRYGEHMARFWLDVARYGDTHGLHLDNYREMWPYRDWVVRAFNMNMPFDQFVTEQLAGDLLPDATQDQKIASGFNRCHVTTAEGGSIKEEVYVRNVVDRVVTTGTVFMGLTLECSSCHDHKFDPVTMKDFYSMFAFFNSLDANPMDGNKKDHAPVIRVATEEQRKQADADRKQIETVRQQIKTKLVSFVYREPDNASAPKPPEPKEFIWIDDNVPAGANAQGNTPWKWVNKGQGPVFSGNRANTRTAKGLSQHFFDRAKPLTIGKGDKLFAYVFLDPKNPPKQIMLQWNDGNWEHRAYWGGNHIAWGADGKPGRRPMGKLPATGKWIRLEVDAQHVGLRPGAKLNGWAFTQFDGTVHWDKAGIISKTAQSLNFDSQLAWEKHEAAKKKSGLPKPLQRIIKLDSTKRNAAQNKRLRDHFIEYVYTGSRKTFDPLHQKIDQLNRKIESFDKSAPTTLVYKELPKPKPAYILKRGDYTQRLEQVQRKTPEFLQPMKSDLPQNRLGFARWLLDPKHPLTSRVTVNRYWQQVFGIGLVKTSEDFGSQGEPPSHPELLDYLAVDFRESGWDVRRFMKKLVMSSTYRQSSKVNAALITRDPENRLLARGPRFRLDAETLRDQALFVSDLLNEKMGGPSVKPPQPDGLWFAVGYSGSNTVRFKKDSGSEKVHRRSLYTFWKRTSPPPQMTTFDAPSRESCTTRRERTNTPLQALLLLNDPQYVEAARAFAQLAMNKGPASAEGRIAFMFERATARPPANQDTQDMLAAYRDHLAEFKADPDAAKKLIAIGEIPPDASLNASELAAWTMVANLILNLDEVITK